MRKNELTALINNFNTDCHKQYTNVSNYLGNRLDESLKEIEQFYYSEFWEDRFKQRLKQEHLQFIPIELDIIQGMSSELREETKFKLFDENQNSNGISNHGTMIALNINMNEEKLNDSHINNVIMHEFGHRQYNQKEFKIVAYLNKKIIGTPGLYIKDNQTLSEKDYPYFVDDNELRQRIIPIIKEMWDNSWDAEEAYGLSKNLEIDDIKDIFTKDYILDMLKYLL